MPLSKKITFRPFPAHRKIIFFLLFLIILGDFPRTEKLPHSLYFNKNWIGILRRPNLGKKKARNRAVVGVLRVVAGALVYELRAQ